MCAYNYYCGAGDTAPGGRPRVKPGDTVLVHAGIYAYQYEYYANDTTINATTTYEGTYYLTADGTAERPIVIEAAGSAAIDRGVALPNVTDGFGGKAPDLGALESGQAPPIYGPRPVRPKNED